MRTSIVAAILLVVLPLAVPPKASCPPSSVPCPYDGQAIFYTGQVRVQAWDTYYEFAHGIGAGRHTTWIECHDDAQKKVIGLGGKTSWIARGAEFGVNQGDSARAQTAALQAPEITPRRPECAILLPERGERNDVAKLLRAEEFLRCERDGFPANLTPPWKTDTEAEKKLGDACEYFSLEASRDFGTQVGPDQLQFARARCNLNVATVILYELVRGLGTTK